MLTPPPLPSRRFQFPALAFLLIAAGWALTFFAKVEGPSGQTTAGIVGYHLGPGAMMFALPLLITWTLWKLCKLHPDGTKIIAWTISSFVVVASITSIAKEAVEKRDVRKQQIREMTAEIRKERQAGLAPDASAEDVLEAQRNTAKILRERGEKMTGDDGKLLRAMAAPLEKLQLESTAYVQLAAEFSKNPVLDTSTIKDLEEIDRRLERVEQLRQGNQKLKAATIAFEDDIREAIHSSGISEAQQKSEWQGFQKSFGSKKSLMVKMRSLDEELTGRMQHTLSLLRDEWGKWQHNETGELTFESEHTMAEYNRQIERIQTIADEETKIQGRLSLM